MDVGYGMLDAGYRMQDSGCGILDAGFWMLDAGCKIRDAGYERIAIDPVPSIPYLDHHGKREPRVFDA